MSACEPILAGDNEPGDSDGRAKHGALTIGYDGARVTHWQVCVGGTHERLSKESDFMTLHHVSEGQGPAVVLLHGFPLNRATWDAQRTDLRDAYRVIVPDLPGMGASPVVSSVATMDDMADEVMALLDDLGEAEPVVVGGLSMGGYVVLSLMERYPERLRAAMLLDTRADADTPEAAQSRRALADRIEAAGSIDEVVNSFLPKLLGKTTHAKRPAVVERVRQIMGTTTPAGAAACLRGMADRPDRQSVLAESDAPVLVVVGDEDAITPPDEAERMCEALVDGQFAVVASSGHLTIVEQPDVTTAAMRKFLQALD